MDGVGGSIAWIDQRSHAASRNAPGISRDNAGSRRRIHRLKRVHPAVLRQIVEKKANPGANHRPLRLSRRVYHTKPRPKLLAVIMRHAANERNPERTQG